MNIVLDDAVEEKTGGEKVRLGMVVCFARARSFAIRILSLSLGKRCFWTNSSPARGIGHSRKLGGNA